MSLERLKRIKVNTLISFSITAFFAILLLTGFPPIESIENKLYDLRFRLRGPVKAPENIVIAAIDEKSIERLGRWPWDRNIIARLVDRLSEAGSELIVFDTFFSEPAKYDAVLGKAIDDAGNVLLPIVFDFTRQKPVQENKLLRGSAIHSVVNKGMFNTYAPIKSKSVLLPVPGLMNGAMSLGHISIIPDDDGMLRHETNLVAYNGYLYPAIDIQAASLSMGIPLEKITVKATEGIELGSKRYIPTDRFGRSPIFFYGPDQTFKHFPISDIVEGAIKPKDLMGKIVLIGASAIGIYDLRVTPFSPAMPGVEKHANVIASIIEGRFITKASRLVDLVIFLFTGLIAALLISRFRARGASAFAALFLVFIFAAGYYALIQKNIWINIAYPVMNTIVIFTGITAFNYATEEKYARKIRSMFSSYVTERVVNELIKNPGMAKLGGERKDLTILFSDVRGFTSFSETHPPEEVVPILNEYLGVMTDIIFKWEGTLDKFMGDAILAFWGAPMEQKNHAELAVRCALQMRQELLQLQEKWKAEGKQMLNSGIGINTGEALVGNIGAEGKKMDYTVIGDHVNLGARIEALTKKYGAHILISEFTLDKIKELVFSGKIGHVSIKGLEKVVVKGKKQSVSIYEFQSIESGMESVIAECEDDRVIYMEEK
jgi:adenylate cyclase